LRGVTKARNDNEATDSAQDYASPPCLMHLLDPVSGDLVFEADAQQRTDVVRWRKAERERLIAARLAIPGGERRACSQRIAERLDEALGDIAGRIVSAYWPIRGEPDLRVWMEGLVEQGGASALPVVVQRHAPLTFRRWRRGDALEPGVWNIPVPSAGAIVTPDIVIAPVVGFDPACYRLGYGGGFFDRTLAALPRRPRIIGVGYARQEIRTIFPQAHDVSMDMIVTEAGIVTPARAG
jgi:5,10-methenyltetrahydrofolate synthetase